MLPHAQHNKAGQSTGQDVNMSQKRCEIFHRPKVIEPIILCSDGQAYVALRRQLETNQGNGKELCLLPSVAAWGG